MPLTVIMWSGNLALIFPCMTNACFIPQYSRSWNSSPRTNASTMCIPRSLSADRVTRWLVVSSPPAGWPGKKGEPRDAIGCCHMRLSYQLVGASNNKTQTDDAQKIYILRGSFWLLHRWTAARTPPRGALLAFTVNQGCVFCTREAGTEVVVPYALPCPLWIPSLINSVYHPTYSYQIPHHWLINSILHLIWLIDSKSADWVSYCCFVLFHVGYSSFI